MKLSGNNLNYYLLNVFFFLIWMSLDNMCLSVGLGLNIILEKNERIQINLIQKYKSF